MSGMELTVVGAGTILPRPGLSPACHLLRVAETTYIFDLGPGSLPRLVANGVDYRSIDLLFISHLHPDHVLDIVTLLQANNATPGWQRTRPLRLVGCYGLKNFVESLLAIFRDAVPESYALEFVELAVGRHQMDDVVIEVALTGHTSNSLAFRLETPAGIFVYGGDAADIPAMVDIARGADMFLCECSFLAPYPTDDHLTALSAARIAQSAGVRHLILTHTYPDTNHVSAAAQAAIEFTGKLTLAVDGTDVTC